jgi:hypothetical protein
VRWSCREGDARRRGLQARLELENTSAAPIELVSVDVRLTDLDGLNRSAGFDLIPETPTSLGTIGVGGSKAQDWILLPRLLGVTDPEGEPFLASARITYTWGGQTFFNDTVPERITVYPSPDLVITYQLPLPQNACTDFPLKVTIQNRAGSGPQPALSTPRRSSARHRHHHPFPVAETTVNSTHSVPRSTSSWAACHQLARR